jgi:hypothetical protein
MLVRRVLAGAVVAATGFMAVSGVAAARPSSETTARVIGIVRIDRNDPSVAYVSAVYSCTAEKEPAELWVSVKQNDAGTRDPALEQEGSGFGGTATRWEDSHRNAVDCDGRRHIGTFVVDQIEDKGSYDTLTRGRAWVQFCLFDDNTPRGNGQTDFGEPVSSMVWRFAA